MTQIRAGAPPRERAFFGVGPVKVGVPLRVGTDDRMRSYIDASDVATQEDTTTLLTTLALATEPYTIAPDATAPPDGDVVVICGPKSAPIGAQLLAEDPCLTMVREDRWWLVNKATGDRWGSPLADDPPTNADLGYLSRRRDGDRVLVHIAGIRSPGSRGVLHYLARYLRELWAETGESEFSAVVRCELDGLTVTESRLFAGPFPW